MKEMLKKVSIGLVVLPVLGLMLASAAAGGSSAAAREEFDAAAVYKAKCAMCHTANASKNFDPAKTDEQLTESILKGVKGEKPPFMPAYEAKGVTPEQAKALAAHMRTLKQ